MVHKTDESAENSLSRSGNKKLDPQEFKRQEIQYEDLTNDFNDDIDFSKQFCHIYAVRLAELREILISQVIKKWGKLYIKCFVFNKRILV